MSDIKKFTGYLSSDGKSHTSQKAAITHEQELKTKKALGEEFSGARVIADEGSCQLDVFLYENRERVLAALNQEVLLRKKRTPKGKPASSQAPAGAPSAPPANSTPVQLQPGIYDADS